MNSERVNARLPESLARHVSRMVDIEGFYETPSEYIRDLIRRDMEKYELQYVHQSIREGYQDIANHRYFKSSGNFKKDMKILKKKESTGWR